MIAEDKDASDYLSKDLELESEMLTDGEIVGHGCLQGNDWEYISTKWVIRHDIYMIVWVLKNYMYQKML